MKMLANVIGQRLCSAMLHGMAIIFHSGPNLCLSLQKELPKLSEKSNTIDKPDNAT